MRPTKLESCINMARIFHEGQVDKCGKPYILHPLRVMLAVSERAQCVAVLHDVVEDTVATFQIFEGVLDEIEMRSLVLVTRPEARPPAGPAYWEYIAYIERADGEEGKIAREVKIADLRDNLHPARQNYDGAEAMARDRFEPSLKALVAAEGSRIFAGN